MGAIQVISGQSQTSNRSTMMKLDLKIDLTRPVLPQLQQLCHWSFQDIRNSYSAYQRKTQCPFIDSFILFKILPFQRPTCKTIYEYFTRQDKYVVIYQIICIIVLMSHHTYRRKMQLLYLIFDFKHSKAITTRDLILIFESCVYGYCRVTGQHLPSYDLLSRYTYQYFIKSKEGASYSKTVKLRRLIDEIEGSQVVHELLNRFQQAEYINIKEDYVIYSELGFKKYAQQEVQKIYRILNKVYKDKDYMEVEQVEINRQLRLGNRRYADFQIKEENSRNYRTQITKNQSVPNFPPIQIKSTTNPEKSKNKKKIKRKLSQIQLDKIQLIKGASLGKVPNVKFLFLNGKTVSKRDIFQSITYFRTLSNNEPDIRAKEFFKSFQKKSFLKTQLSSLFRVIDKNQNGQISFEEYLDVLYPHMEKAQLDVILKWHDDYFRTYYTDSVGNDNFKSLNRDNFQILPKNTLKRIQEIFEGFDVGKKGYLTFDVLLQNFKDGFTIRQIEGLMKDYAINGRIEFKGFVKMLLPQGWIIDGYSTN